jgi:PAS domain S-box-containing protein
MAQQTNRTAASNDGGGLGVSASADEASGALALYRQVFELMPGSILLMDDQAVVMDANPAFCRQIGYAREELVGQHVSLFSKDSPDIIARNLERLLAGELLEHEVTNLQKDGTPRHYELHEKAITLPDGSRRILAVSNDITRRVAAEQEKLKLQGQVLHAEKLKSLGLMAGGIAHEFNNLLAAVIGNLELSLPELDDKPVIREILQKGLSAATRAAHLTHQMLAYSGRGRFRAADLDLNDIVRSTAGLLHASISPNASLQLKLGEALPKVNGDASQLQQIVANLVTNASESLGDRPGLIRVHTSVRECDSAALVANRAVNQLQPGRFVVLEVADSGCGMNDTVQQQLFEPFFSTKFTGRGLGLPAVLGIVRGHNGGIFVTSRVGQGTTMSVFFPAGAVQPPDAHTTGSGARAAGRTRIPSLSGTVLVADDEAFVRSLVERILQRTGLRVLLAEDGEQAVERFKEHAAEITFVVLDLTMPKLDGVGTLAALRRHKADVKAILTSGYSESDITERSVQEGFVAFVSKPYQPASLMELARQICTGEL